MVRTDTETLEQQQITAQRMAGVIFASQGIIMTMKKDCQPCFMTL